MNTKNNRRRKESIKRIEETFLRLIEDRELESITVSELCKECDLNRSTFYANFMDIYDLADHVRDSLEAEVERLYQGEGGYTNGNFLKLFCHIRDNQSLYRTYFKLGYAEKSKIAAYPYDAELTQRYFDGKHVPYHMEFFRQGFNAIVKMWLLGGCKESPEEMAEILKTEYQGRMGLV